MRAFCFSALLLLASAAIEAAQLPSLRLHAPESLLPAAREIDALAAESLQIVNGLIRADLTDEPIDVVLAPEGSDLAVATPEYVSGYANGATSTIVLFPSRASRYPHNTLGELLRHELAHILIHRASGGAPLPRWFHEGLAITASGRWDLEDRARLVTGLWKTSEPRMAAVERGFYGSAAEMAQSYAVARGFVRHLLARHGADTPGQILALVRAGRPFEEAFTTATGQSFAQVEDEFWGGYRAASRWLPLVTSSIVLWMAITLLALWAFRRRKRRDAKLRELWELEDQLGEFRNSEDRSR
jgi:hypothetical protein